MKLAASSVHAAPARRRPGHPSPRRPQGHGNAAFLFGYRAKPGMEADFAEGYRRCVAWHAERQDSLAWLGWSVISGAGLGMFVDGVFGARFQAMDDSVDPQGDARDAALNVTAYADAMYRYVYRLRRGPRADRRAGRPWPDGAPGGAAHARRPGRGPHHLDPAGVGRHQSWDISRDGGATWAPLFEGLYRPRGGESAASASASVGVPSNGHLLARATRQAMAGRTQPGVHRDSMQIILFR